MKTECQKAAKEREIKEDINQFKVLQEKIVGKPKGDYSTNHQGFKGILVKEQIRRLFSEDEVETKLKQAIETSMTFKQQLSREKTYKSMHCIDDKMRQIKNRFSAYCEAQNLQR